MANIIFDYDGTLHDTMVIYGLAFRKAYKYLVDCELVEEKHFEDDDIKKWLGYTSVDMWNNFLPNIDDSYKDKASKMIGEEMLELTSSGRANIYDGSIDTLKVLKNRGHKLIFLSNCKIKYMNTHRKTFGLDDVFDDFYCAEEYPNTPKYEIFNHIKKKYTGNFIIIGDRFHDMEIAEKHNLKSIACTYGYGTYDEIKNANYKIDSIYDILNIDIF